MTIVWERNKMLSNFKLMFIISCKYTVNCVQYSLPNHKCDESIKPESPQFSPFQCFTSIV